MKKLIRGFIPSNKILTSDELSEKVDKGGLPIYQGKPNFIFKKNK